MRRFTFSVMLALATVAVNAQETSAPTWTDDLTTTKAASDLHRGGAMTIDKDGNSIVTGSYNKNIAFGSSNLAQSEFTSTFIAKYDKSGAKKWAAALSGAATITTITTDTEGNIYAAGVFADEVSILNAKGETKRTIMGMEDQEKQVSGFIVKFNKDGEYQASKVVIPELTCTDDSYWLPDPAFTPKKIAVCGDNIILSAIYKTKNQIDGLTLEGQYGYQDWGYTFDVATLGVISLSKDLSTASLVAQLAATEKQTSVGYGAEDINFTTDGSKVYVGFVAYGDDLTLKAANNSKQITNLLSQTEGEETKYEHAFIVATIENGYIISDPQIFHSKIDDNLSSAKFNTIDAMDYKEGYLYLAGTFNETFPFDNTKSYQGGSDTYGACLNAKNLEKKWAVTSNYNEGDAKYTAEVVSCMQVFDDASISINGWAENTSNQAITTPLLYLTWGEIPTKLNMSTTADLVTSQATNGVATISQRDNVKSTDEDKTNEGTYTYTFYSGEPSTGIKQIAATSDNTINFDGNTVTLVKAADIDLYTVSGALVKSAKNVSSLSLDNVASGMYLLKAGKQTVKIVK